MIYSIRGIGCPSRLGVAHAPSTNSFIFFGLHSQTVMEQNPDEGTYWIASCQEHVVAYWVVALLVFLRPMIQSSRWVLRRIRPSGGEGAEGKTDQEVMGSATSQAPS